MERGREESGRETERDREGRWRETRNYSPYSIALPTLSYKHTRTHKPTSTHTHTQAHTHTQTHKHTHTHTLSFSVSLSLNFLSLSLFSHLVNFCIIKHHKGALPAQFQAHALEIALCSILHDLVPDGRRAGEGYLVDAGVACYGLQKRERERDKERERGRERERVRERVKEGEGIRVCEKKREGEKKKEKENGRGKKRRL